VAIASTVTTSSSPASATIRSNPRASRPDFSASRGGIFSISASVSSLRAWVKSTRRSTPSIRDRPVAVSGVPRRSSRQHSSETATIAISVSMRRQGSAASVTERVHSARPLPCSGSVIARACGTNASESESSTCATRASNTLTATLGRPTATLAGFGANRRPRQCPAGHATGAPPSCQRPFGRPRTTGSRPPTGTVR
jgi:hypothetical protein